MVVAKQDPTSKPKWSPKSKFIKSNEKDKHKPCRAAWNLRDFLMPWGFLMSAWSKRALQEAEPLLGSHHQLVRWDGVFLIVFDTSWRIIQKKIGKCKRWGVEIGLEDFARWSMSSQEINVKIRSILFEKSCCEAFERAPKRSRGRKKNAKRCVAPNLSK